MIAHLKKIYREIGRDGLVLIACTLSVFFASYLCVVVQFLAFIYAIRKYSLKRILSAPYAILPTILLVPGLAVGFYYKNYLGLMILIMFFMLYIFSIYEKFMMTEQIRDFIIYTAIISSIIAAIAAAVQKYPNPNFRSVSLFLNANFYGYLCELMLVLIIYAFYCWGPKPIFFIAAAANALGMWMSGCRSAWLATAAGIVVLIICLKKYRHLIFAAIAFGFLSALALLFPEVLFPRLQSLSNDKSLRVLIWKTAWGYVKENPIFGHGMFAYYTLSTGRAHNAHAHDFILDVLVNFGIVGFIIVAIFIFLIMRDLIKNLKYNKTCALVIAALSAAFVHGIDDIPFIGVQTSSFTILIIALAGTYGIYTKPELLHNADDLECNTDE
ncbi:O-antigen ligase family protein [[Clostridium] cellulosi]